MGRGESQRVTRMPVAVLAALATLLVEVAPLLGGSPSTADLLVASMAVLALTGALVVVSSRLVLAPSPGVLAPARSAPAPVLRGRVTDPVHHPVAPRAPGLA